jgi:alpha-galactosidase
VTVNQYVAADVRQSVVFAFRHSQQYNTPAPTIYLRGLEEKATYKIEAVDNNLSEKQPTLSGAYLMHRGLNVNLRGDFDSTAVILEKQ